MNENDVADNFSPVFSGATSALCFWLSMTTVLADFDHMKHLQIPFLRHHDHNPHHVHTFFRNLEESLKKQNMPIWCSEFLGWRLPLKVPVVSIREVRYPLLWHIQRYWVMGNCRRTQGCKGTAGWPRAECASPISKRARNKSDAHPLLACVSQAHSSS